jgi:hypothetical protein
VLLVIGIIGSSGGIGSGKEEGEIEIEIEMRAEER